MFACHKCRKQLSSRQALQYHMASKQCRVQRTSSQEKMRLEANLTIICTLDGVVKECEMKNEIIKTSQFIGKHVFDLFECCNNGCKIAEFCKKHVNLLLHQESIERTESINLLGQVYSNCIFFIRDDSLELYCIL